MHQPASVHKRAEECISRCVFRKAALVNRIRWCVPSAAGAGKSNEPSDSRRCNRHRVVPAHEPDHPSRRTCVSYDLGEIRTGSMNATFSYGKLRRIFIDRLRMRRIRERRQKWRENAQTRAQGAAQKRLGRHSDGE